MGWLAFVGGTGPQGRGLALRFAAAGEGVLIGSRVAERAQATAATIRSLVPAANAYGYENLEAIARADRIFLTFPFSGLVSFLMDAAERLAGKLVIDVIVPLTQRGGFFELLSVPNAASAGELIQQAVPTARVVSAFKNLSAEKLADLGAALEGDIILCGEDDAARADVGALVRLMPGLRAIDAGRLANTRYVEAITPLLLNLNRKYRTRTSIAILGL